MIMAMMQMIMAMMNVDDHGGDNFAADKQGEEEGRRQDRVHEDLDRRQVNMAWTVESCSLRDRVNRVWVFKLYVANDNMFLKSNMAFLEPSPRIVPNVVFSSSQ